MTDVRASPAISLILLLLGVPAVARADDGDAALEKQKAAVKLKAQIPLAVERGVAWLTAKQRDDGSFGTTLDEGGGGAQPAGHAGHRLGRTAIVLYTLVHCGRTIEDPVVAKGLALLRDEYRSLLAKSTPPGEAPTYSISLALMLLHELFAHAPLILDEEGKPEGDRVKPTASNPLGLPSWAHRMVRDCMRWLEKTRAPSGLFGYPTPIPKPPRGMKVPKALKDWVRKNGRTDNSNTQFAMLGLWAGTRLGARLDRRTLTGLADAILASQSDRGPKVRRRFEPDAGGNPADARYAGPMDEARGFPYARAVPRVKRSGKGFEPVMAIYETGSMTAGGLSSLLIAKAMLTEADALDPKRAEQLDQAIWDALAWLGSKFRVDGNPNAVNTAHLPPAVQAAMKGGVPGGASYWPLYYLYGLERACVIAGRRYVGTHDWYHEGAQAIVGWQAQDGRFVPRTPDDKIEIVQGQFIPDAGHAWMDLPNTCFALLFLKRASLRPRARLIRMTAPAEAEK